MCIHLDTQLDWTAAGSDDPQLRKLTTSMDGSMLSDHHASDKTIDSSGSLNMSHCYHNASLDQ